MKFPEMLLGQVGSGPLTILGDGVHIFLLGGFWDTTEPEVAEEFIRLVERNASVRGTSCV